MAQNVDQAVIDKTVADAGNVSRPIYAARAAALDEYLSPEDAISLHQYNLSSKDPKTIPNRLSGLRGATIEYDTAAEIGVTFDTRVENDLRNAHVRLASNDYSKFLDPAQRRHDDQFLVDFETNWHNTRGRIDPMFYIMNAEDAHLLGMDAEATQRLASTERLWINMDKATAAMNASQEARTDLVMANYNVTREEAATLLTKYDVAVQQGDQKVASMTDEEILKYAGYKTNAELGMGFAGDADSEAQTRAKYLASGKATIWNETVSDFAKDVLPQGYQGRDFHNIMMGKDYTPAGLAMSGVTRAFGVLGGVVNGAVNVTGWLLEAGGVSLDGAGFQRGFDMLFGDSKTVEAARAQKQWLNDEAGRTHEDLVAMYASQGLLAGWEAMKQGAADEVALYINMAGGDESLARAMWSEDAQYMGITMEDGHETSIAQQAEAAARLYENQIGAQVELLQDENFGVSDALLSLLAIWGEGVENLATVATLGAKQLWEDGNDLLWTGGLNRPKNSWSLKDLYRDVREADTPAGALGIEGTLTGLAFNLGSMALLDPMTWIFGPRLGRAGRSGAISAEQATAMIESRVADITRREMIDISRSSYRSATAFSTLLNTYGETGLASQMLGTMRGFKNPLTGFWKGLEKWGKVSDDVYTPTLRGMMPEGVTYTDDVLEAAHNRLLSGEYDPVVVEYNPTTGTRQIVEGGELVAAAEKFEIGNLPATLKRSSKFGVVEQFTFGRNKVMPDEDLALIRDAAENGVEVTHKGSDELTRQNLLSAGEALKEGAANRGIIELGGQTYKVKAKGDFYIVLNAADEVVGAWTGAGSVGKAVDLPAGVMGRVADIAFDAGDDLVSSGLRSGSISTDGAAFIENQAKRVMDKVERSNAEGLIPADWVNASADTRVLKIDGVDGDFVSPQQLMPDDIRWGDNIDFDELKRLEFNHIMRGGDPMNANRTAMSVSLGYTMRDTLTATNWGRRLESYMTPVNTNTLLTHTGPTALSNTMNVLSRIFASADDMAGLELANRRIMNYWNRHGQLTREASELTERQAALQAQMRGYESAIGGRYASQMDLMDPTTRLFELTDTEVGGQMNLFQSIDRLKPEQGPVPPGTETVQQVGRAVDDTTRSLENAPPESFAPGEKPVLPQENLFQSGTPTYGPLPSIEREIQQSIMSEAERNAPAVSAVRQKIYALDEEITRLRQQQRTVASQLKDFSELNSILDDIFDEFLQKHVATNPAFKDLLVPDEADPTKMVIKAESVSTRSQTPLGQAERSLARARADKSTLGQATFKELGYVPEFMKSIIEVVDSDQVDLLMKFIDETQHGGVNSAGYAMAMSPLEYMAAANGSPSVMKQLARSQTQQQLRAYLHLAHNYWMIDKVMTPRTAATVSLDELIRAWHTGGSFSALQYFEDKIMNGVRLVNKQMNLPSFARLETRWKNRIQALQEYPDFFKQMQTNILDNKGYGFDTIAYRKGHNNTDYYAAAQETAQQRLREPGWQAYFKGRESFKQWFETDTAAELLRGADYWDAASNLRKIGPKWEEVWNGYETLYELTTKNLKAEKKATARKAWADAAEKSASSEAAVTLPNWVLEGYGEVSGAAKIPSAALPRGVEYVSDFLFQRPMNYRQGFLAEWVRKSEMARLEKLYKSQGVAIVSDEQLMSLLRNKYPGLHERFLREGLDSIAMDLMELDTGGIVSQRAVRRMVESKVVAEMENQLYGFHMQSAAGRKARAVAPFGKPWADMWGFWGREMLGRPQLRGLLNSENYGRLSQYANKLADSSPINPKTAGFVSRLAATDFDLNKIEDDPLFGGAAKLLGIDRMDVGSSLFLPHGGESPWLVLLPGLGAIPGVMVEAVLMRIAPDPIDDPTGYQMFTDQWSKVLPGIGYNRQSSLGGIAKESLIGGGVIGRTVGLMDDIGMMLGNDTSIAPNAISADWKTAMAYDRQVKVAFADPKMYDELLQLPPDQAAIGIEAMINEALSDVQKKAAREVGASKFAEDAIELLIPSRIDTLTQREDLADVWLNALPYLDVSDTFKSRLLMDTEENRQASAGRIADWFYNDITPDQRDNYIAAHPELAVNVISMWTWSESALIDQIPGSGLAYRSGGSTEDRNRHETMIELGYIRPLTPRELAVRIIGTVASAKAGAARRVFEGAAKAVNDDRWANLPVDYKDWFEYLRVQLVDAGETPYQDARQVWENFDKIKEQIWYLNGEPTKIEKHPKTGDIRVPDKISLPQKRRPWGESLPSEFKDLRQEYEEGYPLPTITDEMAAAAAAVGIDLEPGMEMADVYQAVANTRAAHLTDNPAFSIVGPEYQAYLAPRSAAHQDVIAKLNVILDAEGVSEETRYNYRKTFVFLEDAIERRHAGDQSWLEIRDKAAQLFKGLQYDDIFRNTPLNFYWDSAWGSQLGALDWTPDKPAPLLQENGQLSSQAMRIYPREVYDGDTIKFSSSPNEHLFGELGGPRIDPTIYSVRMLGVNAREMGEEGGDEDRLRLETKIREAVDNHVPIYIVKDPDRYGYTDFYGRLFGWVYIGNEAFEVPSSQYPRR